MWNAFEARNTSYVHVDSRFLAVPSVIERWYPHSWAELCSTNVESLDPLRCDERSHGGENDREGGQERFCSIGPPVRGVFRLLPPGVANTCVTAFRLGL